ncbi:MAG: SecDF P1 head subdomain-containing protein, partial [Planctomycetota bacterium]
KRAVLLGGTALCLLALALVLVGRTQWRTYRRQYRLLLAPGEAAAPRLARAVDVLSARLQALKDEFRLSRCGVRPVPPDRLELTMRYGGDPTHPLAWLTMQGKVEFRLLHPRQEAAAEAPPADPPPGCEVKLYRERRSILGKLGRFEPVEHRYVLERTPALSVSEFQGVDFAIAGRESTVVLTFHFKGPDREAFGQMTALHAGRRMAMLIDGAMFFPPKQIESAVTAGSVQVQGFFHILTQRRLARMLNSGSLPGPIEEVAAGRAGGAARPPARPSAGGRNAGLSG